MRKFPHWAKNTPVRSLKRTGRALFALFFSAALFGGSSHQSTPVQDEETARAAPQSTEAHPAGPPSPPAAAANSALALLRAGITAQQQKQPAAAVRDLRAVRTRVPRLADYVAYSLASADYDLGDFQGALTDLQPVWTSMPPSPLTGESAVLAARAYRESGKPAESVRVLREYYSQLPQPAGDSLLAACYRLSSDMASSAVYYQHVYYQYPLSGDAEQAASALADLKATLGELYPPPTTQAMFQRAERLVQAGDYRRARVEYEAMLTAAGGTDREIARVRLGVLDFLAYQTASAASYLTTLNVSSPEADAERWYYLEECARRQDRDDLIQDAIRRLERYPQSPWRLKALFSAGNRYLLTNRADLYVPLYRACYESFSDTTQADYCHWKVTWNTYMQRRPEAVTMMREHLEKFPGGERATSALYFLGRQAEGAGSYDAAKAYYTEIVERFPNRYYDELAGRRLTDPAVFRATESAEVRSFLNGVVWPVRRFEKKFDPSPITAARIERARMLYSAGLEDLAETELRYGARREDQPHVLAMHMAAMTSKYGQPHRALRLIKSLVPGYLSIPVEDAPASFWRLLYPMPWRTDLERNARLHDLDPYIVAGLIRQESEFNPEAVSSAQAYGLTQLLPSTGRMLMKAPRRRFRAAVLFQPAVNLRLGTMYLRNMFDNYSGKWELTLASYNAGGSRVQNWLTWGDYREPAEFIETIPFSETRNYVFAVLRNAEMYRKLYSHEASGMLAADHLRAPVRPSAAVSTGRKTSFKRNPVVVTRKHATARHVVRHRARGTAKAKAKTASKAKPKGKAKAKAQE